MRSLHPPLAQHGCCVKCSLFFSFLYRRRCACAHVCVRVLCALCVLPFFNSNHSRSGQIWMCVRLCDIFRVSMSRRNKQISNRFVSLFVWMFSAGFVVAVALLSALCAVWHGFSQWIVTPLPQLNFQLCATKINKNIFLFLRFYFSLLFFYLVCSRSACVLVSRVKLVFRWPRINLYDCFCERKSFSFAMQSLLRLDAIFRCFLGAKGLGFFRSFPWARNCYCFRFSALFLINYCKREIKFVWRMDFLPRFILLLYFLLLLKLSYVTRSTSSFIKFTQRTEVTRTIYGRCVRCCWYIRSRFTFISS